MRRERRNWALLAAAAALSGCMSTTGVLPEVQAYSSPGQTTSTKSIASRAGTALSGLRDIRPLAALRPDADVTPAAQTAPAATPQSFAQGTGDGPSELIEDLLARRSVIVPGSSYDQIAREILSASRRASEAELRAARLRAVSKSKNWLPSIGPNISLTSMGAVAADLMLDQVLFDHGRKQYERDFARADVEVAAVTLSQDMNERIYEGLTLYVRGAKSRELAGLSSQAAKRLSEFDRIVTARVDGGISSPADKRVIRAKLADMRAAQDADFEASDTAMAELQALAGRDFSTLSGMGDLHSSPARLTALSLEMARAEAARDVAQAGLDRANLLPGITANGSAKTGISINIGRGEPIGVGTGAAARATQAQRDVAERKIGEAAEDAARKAARLEQRLAGLIRQEKTAREQVNQARSTFTLFSQQLEAGTRGVMDVANVYEDLAGKEKEHIELTYEIALVQLEIARMAGVLVNGSDI